MGIKDTEAALDNSLARIKKFGDEKTPFSEAALEAVLLIDLFRDELGYDEETSPRQKSHTSEDGKEIPDITLKLVASEGSVSENVFVEIKKYNAFRGKSTGCIKAIRQAAQYATTQGAKYGIVTDGVRWTYFVVTESAKPHKTKTPRQVARKVAEFDLSTNPETMNPANPKSAQLGKLLLQRTRRNKLLTLFSVLSRLNEKVTPDHLAELRSLRSIPKRFEAAWKHLDEASVPAGEVPLLSLLYHLDNIPKDSFCQEIWPLKST